MSKVRFLPWFLVLVLPFFLSLNTGAEDKSNHFLVGFDKLSLAPGERICGISVKLNRARFLSFNRIPMGWNFEIDNDPSWKTELTGQIVVGAAAINLSELTGFLIIEKSSYFPDDAKEFSLRIEIDVTSDFENTRKVLIKAENLKLEKVR